MNYISFFSGALGLDLGLEQSGLSPLLYCERDKFCLETIKLNKPSIPVIQDILKTSINEIRQLTNNQPIDLIVGGPPCQAFSTAGKRKAFDDPRGNVFLKFIEIISEIKPKYIVIENVRGLLSASYSKDGNYTKGSALKHVMTLLENSGYAISFNLYNTANFGVPQIRERVVIIGVLGSEKFPYLSPTHNNDPKFQLKPWTTLKDAIIDLSPEKNSACARFPAKRLKYYHLLKSGENWKNLPIELQKEALGKSFDLQGGKTGFLRRLDWNKPSPTLVTSPTMPATDLAHPVENRPLSVAEYARIQQFPDDWIFAGNIKEQYRQIGNAVPVGFGRVIGEALLHHNNGKPVSNSFQNFSYSRYKFTNENNWLDAFL